MQEKIISSQHSHTNHLVNETSPYLLQHAHNPVDWYPWGEEALAKAKQEDKPILVSIGYAACHWCHVMERESFEDQATAEIMNRDFVNIKIDREERPDLDHIYMDAVQAISGSGGWPLNVFLTPEAKPFYGGTYFPPVPAFNRGSWKDVLKQIITAFREKREEINAQAENLTDHLFKANAFGHQTLPDDEVFNKAALDTICQNLMKQADTEWGGFGKAPKFPQTFSIQYLLRFANTGKGAKSGDGLKQALLSLDRMIEGGIYDQVGGGFARYSTDTEWLAPHFEKMLYDNALLISVLSEAYQLTKKERYREVIAETMEFIRREMLDPSGGFYSALDADSEGEEGKFYVWSFDEINELLKKDAAIFCAYYDVTQRGNWSEGHQTLSEAGKNILRVKKQPEIFCDEHKIERNELERILSNGRNILLASREKRIRPALDDKILLGWNALMNTAASKAFAATGEIRYRQLAIDNMQFIFSNFCTDGNVNFFHTWKNGKGKYAAFLDDYAFLIQALIHLQEVTGDVSWLMKAKKIMEQVIGNFSEEDTGFFYYTTKEQTDVIVRKKEVYDGAQPSGNSIMAYNLHHLSILFDKKEWEDRSVRMLSSLSKAITTYPASFGIWACLLLEMITGTNEMAIVGNEVEELHSELLKAYIPGRVLMVAREENSAFPLLSQKRLLVQPAIYLCRNYTCLAPVFSVKDLISLINNPQNR